MFVGNVFGRRRAELVPAAAAGTTHDECRSDGGVHGRHGALYAQFNLRYRHGVSSRSVRTFHHYGESQQLSEEYEFFFSINYLNDTTHI